MTLLGRQEEIIVVLSAPGSDAEAAADVFEFVVREPLSLLEVKASCDSDNPPTGSAAQIDVNLNGTTIFDTAITIDATESDSDDAATPSVLTNNPTEIAAGDVLDFDIDQIGSTNAGQEYKVTLIVVRAN